MPLKLTRAVSFVLNGGGRGTGTVNSNNIYTISSSQSSILENVNTTTTTITNSGNVGILKDESAPLPPTQATLPLKRRTVSLDMNTRDNSFVGKNSRRNSGSKSSWYKSLASKLNQTWKWSSSSTTNTITSNDTIRPLLQQQDDVNSINRQEKGQSDNHQSNNEILECEKGSKESSPLAILETSENHQHVDPLKQSTSNQRDSSLLEIYAQTPRHFTSEPEVLVKVGRFALVRERESFKTAVFDRCHCATKPCPYAELDEHPPAPEPITAVDGLLTRKDSRWSFPHNMTPNSTSSSIFSMQNSSTHSLPTVIRPTCQNSSALKRHSSQKQQQQQQQHVSRQLNGTFANSSPLSQSGQRPRHVLQSEYSNPPLHPKRSLQSITLRQQEAKNFSSTSSAPETPLPCFPNFSSPNVNCNIPINNNSTCNSSSISSSRSSNRQSRFIVEKSSTPALQTQQKRSSLYSLNNPDSNSTTLPSNYQQQNNPSLSTSPPSTTSLQPHTKICSGHSGRRFELEWTGGNGGSVDLTSVSRSSTFSSIVSTATTNTTAVTTPNNSSPGTKFSGFTQSFSSAAGDSNSNCAVIERTCSKGRRKFEVTVLPSGRVGGSSF